MRTVKSLWLDGAKFIRRIQCPLEYQLRRWYTGISNAMCPVLLVLFQYRIIASLNQSCLCPSNRPACVPFVQMLYTIKGNGLRVAFVEENGGEGAVINDLYEGDVTFFPQALIY